MTKDAGPGRQLFLDDHGIASIENLTKTMHRPQKKGAVVKPNLLTGGSPQTRTGPAWDPQEQLFKLWDCADTREGTSGYNVSSDGVHWTQPVVGQVEFQGSHQIQLTCSRDLRHWQRLADRQPFIGPSPLGGGAYDTMQILPPSFPILRGDELWFYYTGLKYRRAPVNGDRDYGAICLATLRRDGFVSLDAGEEEGTVLTQPMALPSNSDMHVNVDASHGQLLVQFCDAQGRPATDGVASYIVTGNHTDAVIRWPEDGVARYAGQNLSLRFRLREASLFAYWFA